MRGFETIGSATVIAYDGEPILTTDAWIDVPAYFGSWTHDYAIPPAQLDAIRRAKYHWFSHGHPDHLNDLCLPQLTGGEFLLSDHYGNRIKNDLEAIGHRVRVLKDWTWEQLSPSVRVMSIANQNQDSILLIDVAGRLIINHNDSPDFGHGFRVRRIAKAFRHVYLLALHGWGGADMLNLFDPDGTKRTSIEEKRRPIAPRAQRHAAELGATAFIPFSSFHRYQRTDSAWANDLIPELADYASDARPELPPVLPAFVRVDCDSGELTEIKPPRAEVPLLAPEAFGDSWSDPLDAQDKAKIKAYFQSREAIARHFGFIEVRAGGTSVTVDLNPARRDVGLTFDAPRQSLMRCIDHEIFDDMLIGNYMKTTLHNVDSLYPDFTPWVCKYADNGGVKSLSDLKTYFGHYYMRDPVGHSLQRLQTASEMVIRRALPHDSAVFRAARRFYYTRATRPAAARAV